ncbi:hypothetical protein [Brachybacterium atlanticum]|uniref:hypothetical protein n=1 Tax=Brachybacterium atlanticum TaxID=2911888 RepID=UPI0021E07C34|nr:hypothetical protein [Brachybacterium atlanticum]
MTLPRRDTIHVPLSTNSPPYRIDRAAGGDCFVRIHRRGPDLLVLVPPGDGAREFRCRLIAELRAYSVRSVVTRRRGRLLATVLRPSLRLSATYSADPIDALRGMPDTSLRYLLADELSGGPAMDALRRTLLRSPASILPEERSALWVLGARDQFYPSALSAVRRLAELRFVEAVESRAREFAVEMQVTLDELESEGTGAPPTSAW